MLNTHAEFEAARHLLWWHGDQEYGWQPGSFSNALITVLVLADYQNRARLLSAFPEYEVPVHVMQEQGIDTLIDCVTEQEVGNG